jgi:hypothetical protein
VDNLYAKPDTRKTGMAFNPKEGQSEAQLKNAKRIVETTKKMKTERIPVENTWQEAFDYIIPRKGNVTTTRLPGTEVGQDLFDTTAIQANQILGGALHGMLTNPTARFFDMIAVDEDLRDDDQVQSYLEAVADKMFVVLNNSNFQTEVHEIYLDEGAIGTACMFMGEHEDNVVHFAARAMKEIYIEEDNLGRIDTVHRCFKWKPRQIIQEFGEKNVPPFVYNKFMEGCDDEWAITHAVYPNENKSAYFKWKSCYVLDEFEIELYSSGFPEFSFAVPRWTKTSGEKYGRGPGTEMLAEIRMVNKMMETTLLGAEMTVLPPHAIQDDSVIGQFRLSPAGLTVVRAGVENPIKALVTDARIDFGYQAVEDVRKRIRAGFFVDQLQLDVGPQMTATEVMQRTESQLRLMGPVLGRQHFEFLKPVIERLYAIMNRKKLLPPLPKQLEGRKWDVRYSSMIARSQRLSEGQNMLRGMNAVGPIWQVFPEAKDNVDPDEATRFVLELYGVPHRIMRDQNKMKGIREDRAKAQAKAAQMQQQQHESEVARNMAPAVAAAATAEGQ